MTEQEKEWIDNATIIQLLETWRFSPIGNLYFQDKERADYFRKVMTEKRNANPSGWVNASKILGWEK